MKIERIEFITRSYVRENRNKLFLFGDNLACAGYGGQAKEMRGEYNSIGIPTKKYPSMNPRAFFTDAEFTHNKAEIDKSFSKVLDYDPEILVIPAAGIGSGLAQLRIKAPKTFDLIEQWIKRLHELSR